MAMSEWCEGFGRGGQIRTADPLRPRQIAAPSENALFSTAYVSMRYGQPVEACGTLLNPEAPGSYKIDYSGLPPPDVPHVVPKAFASTSSSDFCFAFAQFPFAELMCDDA